MDEGRNWNCFFVPDRVHLFVYASEQKSRINDVDVFQRTEAQGREGGLNDVDE
jgi:hypothetical protein